MRVAHDGIELNVEVEGTEDGPPVAFLHGVSGSARTYGWLPDEITAGRQDEHRHGDRRGKVGPRQRRAVPRPREDLGVHRQQRLRAGEQRVGRHDIAHRPVGPHGLGRQPRCRLVDVQALFAHGDRVVADRREDLRRRVVRVLGGLAHVERRVLEEHGGDELRVLLGHPPRRVAAEGVAHEHGGAPGDGAQELRDVCALALEYGGAVRVS